MKVRQVHPRTKYLRDFGFTLGPKKPQKETHSLTTVTNTMT